ncbi:MAG: hypothetical protein WCI18_05015 [Pseudomonadota bacterium]
MKNKTTPDEMRALSLNEAIDLDAGRHLPFSVRLSFGLLARYAQGLTAAAENHHQKSFLDSICLAIEENPEIMRPIIDPKTLHKNRDLILALMSLVVTQFSAESESVAAIIPFVPVGFLASSQFMNTFLSKENHSFRGRPYGKGDNFSEFRLSAHALIFENIFGLSSRNAQFREMLYEVDDPATGLSSVHVFRMNRKFVDVVPHAGFVLPSGEALANVWSRFRDGEDVSDVFPLAKFSFEGISVARTIDVTVRETLSRMKETIIDKESVTSRKQFHELESGFQKILHEPSLCMSLVYVFDGRYFRVCSRMSPQGDRILETELDFTEADEKDGPYAAAVCSSKAVILSDLTESPFHSKAVDQMIEKGVKGLHVSPLILQGSCIGFIELFSMYPVNFAQWNHDALAEVQMLVALALHRAISETNSELDRIIKQNCTSVHPCVEWVFKRAAFDYYQSVRREEETEMPLIEFHNIFPLFGSSDIRGSSLLRKKSIAADLGAQMRHACNIFHQALGLADAPWIASLAHTLERHIQTIGLDISAGQEISMLEFIRKECEPALSAVAKIVPSLEKETTEYFESVQNTHRSLYSARARYERSVRALNTALTSEIDVRNSRAQKVFPHIFERHATDGVEHSIYIGDEISEARGFSSHFHLRNIRLWQLITMAESAAIAHRLRPTLEVDLELAHLIVVQNVPITLKFFFDEKRFDVDGAYNTRYEIIKKRLDKSHVKGTGERLTQTGSLAIVFSQEAERIEYLEYLSHLTELGMFENVIEELEVDDLQGVTGLQALRVRFDEEFLRGRSLKTSLRVA